MSILLKLYKDIVRFFFFLNQLNSKAPILLPFVTSNLLIILTLACVFQLSLLYGIN